jgi:hypothetical protein
LLGWQERKQADGCEDFCSPVATAPLNMSPSCTVIVSPESVPATRAPSENLKPPFSFPQAIRAVYDDVPEDRRIAPACARHSIGVSDNQVANRRVAGQQVGAIANCGGSRTEHVFTNG